jgi:hypothetical protein
VKRFLVFLRNFLGTLVDFTIKGGFIKSIMVLNILTALSFFSIKSNTAHLTAGCVSQI